MPRNPSNFDFLGILEAAQKMGCSLEDTLYTHTLTHTLSLARCGPQRAGVCGPGRAGRRPRPRRWRSGLCPGQGGGRSREGYVEQPRGAARGRAGRREPRRGGRGGAQPRATTQPDPARAAPRRRRWVRSPPGAGGLGAGDPAAGSREYWAPRGGTAGRGGLLASRSEAEGAVPPHPLRLGRRRSAGSRLWAPLRGYP